MRGHEVEIEAIVECFTVGYYDRLGEINFSQPPPSHICLRIFLLVYTTLHTRLYQVIIATTGSSNRALSPTQPTFPIVSFICGNA
jgi:hypothetical protein